MRFAFTEEQDELRRQARALLDEREPTWDELAELGWLGVSVPEEAGGAGLGFVEEAVLFEELGRALYPGPYFATVALALPGLPPDEQALVARGERKFEDDEVSLDGPVTRTRAFAALAAEAVGIAQKALELAIEHAKSREQFGKPIGVYQAVSHPIVNTYVETELARSLAYWAAWCVAEGDDEATGGRARREVVRRRDRRRRVRALDPGARRHRLHLGAPAAPLLQARAVDRGLRRLSREAAGRGRGQPARLSA